MLSFRTVTPSSSPRFNVVGTDLNVALFGRARYALYEVRVIDADGFPDREYVVRDAEGIGDDAVREGKRPPIVGRTRDWDAVQRLVAKINAEATMHDNADQLTRVEDVRPGDALDLEGDALLDPDRDNVQFEHEYQEVAEVRAAVDDGSILLIFADEDEVFFPRGHLVRVRARGAA